MAKQVVNMDDDELMEAWTKAAEDLESAKAKCLEYSTEFKKREAENVAREKFDAMSDAERAALAQVMHAEGIESQESVNNG